MAISNTPIFTIKKCKCCGKEFISMCKSKLYCRKKCKQNLIYWRKQEMLNVEGWDNMVKRLMGELEEEVFQVNEKKMKYCNLCKHLTAFHHKNGSCAIKDCSCVMGDEELKKLSSEN